MAGALVAGLVLMGCTDEGAPTRPSPSQEAASAPSPSPLAVAPREYTHLNFSRRLDSALAAAGSVRFRVERPLGYAATGEAMLGGAHSALRLRTTGPDSRPDRYIEIGRTICLSRSVMNEIGQVAGFESVPSDLPWNCVKGNGMFSSLMRSTVDGYDPVGVLAGLDPWWGFELLGRVVVGGESIQHLRVSYTDGLVRRDSELWIDDAGLPRKLVWPLESGATAEAVFEGWGDPVDVALPPESSRTEYDPMSGPSTFARGPQPPAAVAVP